MKLVVFDVDGVLLDLNPGGFTHLAIAIGRGEEVIRIRGEYESKRSETPWGLETLASLFQSTSYERLRKLAHLLCKNHLMLGAEEAVGELRSRGYSIALLSSNPSVLLEELKSFVEADFVSGNELEVEKGICTGRLLRRVDRYTKEEDLCQIIEENSIAKSEVYIVGDSVTDVPMSRHGHFISFNSKDREIDAIAQYIVKEKDLRRILELVPS